MTLALKPAIVFPPGRPASEAAQSVRDGGLAREERERWREAEGGKDGCHGYLPGDASALVYLLAGGACTAGPPLR